MDHTTPPRTCSRPDCSASYVPHRWGSMRAHREGWFTQRNGDAWCPEHVPEWVAGWRARQQEK